MALNLVKPLRGNPRRVRGFQAHLIAGPAGAWHGIDDGCVVGTDILACESGTISNIQKLTTGGGWNFRLNLTKYPGHFIWYAHCSVLPTNGQVVSRGQVIAKSGNTGNTSGPHLHWSLMRGSTPLDPETNATFQEGGTTMIGKDHVAAYIRRATGRQNPTEAEITYFQEQNLDDWNTFVKIDQTDEATAYRVRVEAALNQVPGVTLTEEEKQVLGALKSLGDKLKV